MLRKWLLILDRAVHITFDRRCGLTITVSAPILVRLAKVGLGLARWSRRLRIPTPLLIFNLVVAPACQIAVRVIQSV